MLGSIDANRGDYQNGWDTDQFPINAYDTTLAMYAILRAGGFTRGGLNFDAKIRRNSVDPADLFEAHIGGMDAFAAGLLAAQHIIEDGKLEAFVRQRYASFDGGDGRRFEEGRMNFEELATLASSPGAAYADKVGRTSGRQEHLENLIMQYVLGVK
jgi:xylose isomerase